MRAPRRRPAGDIEQGVFRVCSGHGQALRPHPGNDFVVIGLCRPIGLRELLGRKIMMVIGGFRIIEVL